MVRTLIVGRGIASAAYAKTKPREMGEERTAVGGDPLWQPSRVGGEHRMGQPTQLLTGNVLADDRRGPPPQTGKFMLAQKFARRTDDALAFTTDLELDAAVLNLDLGGEMSFPVARVLCERR